MALFLLLYLTLYGSTHAYALWRARALLALGPVASLALAAWMALMVLAPVLVRLSERAGWEAAARALAWVGYLWMGLLFLYVCAAWTLDLVRPLAALAARLCGAAVPTWVFGAKASFLLALALAAAGNLYGFFEARAVRTRHVEIFSDKVPRSVGRFRIVQISDVPLGLLVRGSQMDRIARAVAAAKPDLLVCTGDLVDGEPARVNGLSERLAALNAPAGKLAVTGNHEFYAGLEQSLAFTRKAGFTLLRAEKVVLGGWLEVVGVDDPAGSRGTQAPHLEEAPLLEGAAPSRFLLLLKHRPVVGGGTAGRFDLQLSGHVHGGQLFPFHLAVRAAYRLGPGLQAVGGGSRVYVSRGSGSWGPPVRLFAPPEVTVIDLLSPPS